jgi:hypothetical protein
VILRLLNLSFSLATPLMLLLGLSFLAVRHQRLFLAAFMLLTAFESTRDFAPSVSMSFSGVSVYPEDLVTVVGTVTALSSLRNWHLSRITRTAVLVFTTLVSLGVITWISFYGLKVGVNSWRPQMLIVALFLYTTTRPRAWSWNDLRLIVVAPAIVVALASVVGILMHGFGSNTSVIDVNGMTEGGRPASAAGSLIILMGLWVTALSVTKWTANRFMIILLLGTTVLLNQDRSVWIAAILGVVVWWFVPRIRTHRASDDRDTGGLIRTLVVVILTISTVFAGLFVGALGQSANNDDTWLWRMSRWADSMSIPRSGVQWLMGSAFGPTPASTPTLFTTSAHSLYVNTIETTGFIGLVVTLILLIAVGRAYVPPSIEPLGLIFCFTFLSFGVSYQLPPSAWMVTGILLAATRTGFTTEVGELIHAKSTFS